MIPGIIAQRKLLTALQTNVVLGLALNVSPYVAFYYADPSDPTAPFIRQAQPPSLPAGLTRDMAFHPNGRSVLVGGAGTAGISVYNTLTWAKTAPGTNVSNVWTVAYSKNGSMFAAGGSGASPYVRLYNSSTGFPVRATLSPTPSSQSGRNDGIAFNGDDSILAMSLAGTSPYMRLYNTTTGAGISQTLPTSISPGAYAIAYSPDGSKVAIQPQNSYSGVRVYDVATWAEVALLPYAYVNTLNWADNILAITSSSILKLINTDTWTEEPTPQGIVGYYYNAVLSKDATVLVICTDSAPFVRAFNLPSLTERSLDVGVTGQVNGAAIFIPG